MRDARNKNRPPMAGACAREFIPTHAGIERNQDADAMSVEPDVVLPARV
jgi:hypothetical protein